ncbi:hypothetical protein Nepgr_019059 [Nepenthes gracilis]|uniref:Nucleoporin NSP1-like C-terminal domain-containing protein n=1 Tax=Nepenthes gracilis TaxID=150966 RepID=A0AAD3XU13_NEPGR|nr:hypothetical protein Nepgr_019059 [Nepenthes gracilis]
MSFGFGSTSSASSALSFGFGASSSAASAPSFGFVGGTTSSSSTPPFSFSFPASSATTTATTSWSSLLGMPSLSHASSASSLLESFLTSATATTETPSFASSPPSIFARSASPLFASSPSPFFASSASAAAETATTAIPFSLPVIGSSTAYISATTSTATTTPSFPNLFSSSSASPFSSSSSASTTGFSSPGTSSFSRNTPADSLFNTVFTTSTAASSTSAGFSFATQAFSGFQSSFISTTPITTAASTASSGAAGGLTALASKALFGTSSTPLFSAVTTTTGSTPLAATTAAAPPALSTDAATASQAEVSTSPFAGISISSSFSATGLVAGASTEAASPAAISSFSKFSASTGTGTSGTTGTLTTKTSTSSLSSQPLRTTSTPATGLATSFSVAATDSSSITSAAQTLASSVGTSSAAIAQVASAPRLPSEITGKTVEEIIKEWNSELQERAKKFQKHASAIAEWNKRILQIRDVLLRLETEVAKVVDTQTNLEQQLELTETHQQEVDKTLQSMEEEAERIYRDECGLMLNDEAVSAREAMYEQGESIERELQLMKEQVKSIIQTLNANQGGDLDTIEGMTPLDVEGGDLDKTEGMTPLDVEVLPFVSLRPPSVSRLEDSPSSSYQEGPSLLESKELLRLMAEGLYHRDAEISRLSQAYVDPAVLIEKEILVDIAFAEAQQSQERAAFLNRKMSELTTRSQELLDERSLALNQVATLKDTLQEAEQRLADFRNKCAQLEGELRTRLRPEEVGLALDDRFRDGFHHCRRIVYLVVPDFPISYLDPRNVGALHRSDLVDFSETNGGPLSRSMGAPNFIIVLFECRQ